STALLLGNDQSDTSHKPTDTCPVTVPNKSTPPGERSSSFHHGNGVLWTVLWPGGRVIAAASDILPDGSIGVKFPWWRGGEGKLIITGRRLDAPAPPMKALIPEGYGDVGFQASGLIFPSIGCWEISA